MLLQKNHFAGRQWPLVAEVVLNLGTDSVVDINGVVTPLNAPKVVADLITLPPGAVPLNSYMLSEIPADTEGTLKIGTADNPSLYWSLGIDDARGSGYDTLSPRRSNGESVRFTLENDGTPTRGTVVFYLMYVVRNRTNEVQPG